ncbi:acetylhydrolase [Actinomycetes bacterium]|nr:acetylhydrolase [Actinomycetes bacterium]
MLKPEIAEFIARLTAQGGKALADLTPYDVRAAAMEKWAPIYLGTAEPLKSIEYKYFSGPTADLPIAIYRPEGDGPLPAIVMFHGGGWVAGNLQLNQVQHQLMATDTGAVVISVNYQKAPEHKFPIPFDDCFATLEWVSANAKALGINPDFIGVAGDSAGGNLASAVALKARDEKGPKVAFQILIYPATDHKFDYPSMIENSPNYLLSSDAMRWYWDQYVNNPEDFKNPYVLPMNSGDLSGLPPTIIITAEYDPLRDEGEELAKRLKSDGNKVVLHRYNGVIHGFMLMQGFLKDARDASKKIGEELRIILKSL